MPFPSPGNLLSPGIKSGSPALQADSLPSDPAVRPLNPPAVWDPGLAGSGLLGRLQGPAPQPGQTPRPPRAFRLPLPQSMQACSSGTPALCPPRPPGRVRLNAERSRTCPECLTGSAVCQQGQESLQKPCPGSPPPASRRRRPRLRILGEAALRAQGLRLIPDDDWFCAL